MFRYRWPFVLLILPVLLGAATAGPPAEWPQTAAVSPEAYLVLEIPRPRAVLDRLFDPRVVEAITSHAEYQRRRNEPDFQQAMNLAGYFAQRFKTDLPGMLGKLTGGGATLAVGPGERALLIVEAEDAAILKEVHDFFLLIARGEAGQQGQPERVKSADYRGVTGWSFAPNQAHAIVGNRLLVANVPEALTAAIDRIVDADASSMATEPRYRQARKAFAQPPAATVFARADVLKAMPQLEAALDQRSNPLLTLLLAPLVQPFEQADWLAVGLDAADTTLTVNIVSDGRSADAASPSGFARPAQPGGGALPPVNVPRQIAGVSFHRDLHKFYAAKDDLFPQRTSGLIFFENMMGIFFTGRDLTDEVLAELTPDVRLVVAQQEFAPEVGTPDPLLPGFALVLRMRRPERFAPVAEEAWQKALGLINFTRGQQAEPGLILDRPVHAGVKYTMAAFAPPAEADRAPADVRFNFQPAVAMPGDWLILSSTDGLAKDLIDALLHEAKAGPAPVAGTHSIAELDGKALAALLRANRESLILNNMVEKGHGRQEAEGEIATLLAIAESIAQVKITAGDTEPHQLTLELKLDMAP